MNLNIDAGHLIVGVGVIACLLVVSMFAGKAYRKIKRKKAKVFYETHIESLDSLPADVTMALSRSREAAKILDDESMSVRQRLDMIGDCSNMQRAVEAVASVIDTVDLDRKNYHRYDVRGYRKAQGRHDRLYDDLKRTPRVIETVANLTQSSRV